MRSVSGHSPQTFAVAAVLATVLATAGCGVAASGPVDARHSPAPQATATAAVGAMPAPTVTQVVAFAPSPTAVTDPRPTPISTSTPAAPARAAPTRRAASDGATHRYAVTVHTGDRDDLRWFLDELEVEWYLHDDYRVDNIPPGHSKLLFVGDLPGPGQAEIEKVAAAAPGATWLILNEPNRRNGYAPDDIVEELHRLYTGIRSADPEARILSPSILNWEFTCTLCRGYQAGSDWLAEFRAAYADRYAVEPPVDAWAINVYPLDWVHVPMVDLDLTTSQVEGLRRYLDGIPELAGQPIWITEIGLHWGWDGMDWAAAPCLRPAGKYQTEKVVGYLDALFDWLDRDGDRLAIEKAFLYTAYRDITTCNRDYYAGISLFDSPFPGASLTPAGATFRDRTSRRPE